jgi:hypothetical protein
MMLSTADKLHDRNTILVNAQSVYSSLQELARESPETLLRHAADFSTIPCPKPPHRSMWLECLNIGEQQRVGALIERREIDGPQTRTFVHDDLSQLANAFADQGQDKKKELLESFEQDAPASIARALSFYEADGCPCYLGSVTWWMDNQGNFQYSFRTFDHVMADEEERRRTIVALRTHEVWILMTMARLNCHNVELRPAKDTAQHKYQKKSPQAPFSVWHEIVVKEGPEIRAAREAQTTNPAEAETHAVRLHKVRGHFADYRRGSGLFGKYKVLVWVEEHESGQAEHGTVVASLRVE